MSVMQPCLISHTIRGKGKFWKKVRAIWKSEMINAKNNNLSTLLSCLAHNAAPAEPFNITWWKLARVGGYKEQVGQNTFSLNHLSVQPSMQFVCMCGAYQNCLVWIGCIIMSFRFSVHFIGRKVNGSISPLLMLSNKQIGPVLGLAWRPCDGTTHGT